MPIYEYKCPNCALRFELMRPFSQSDKEALCPVCQTPARRLPSLFFSLSKSAEGETKPIAGTSLSCSTCSLPSCDTCPI